MVRREYPTQYQFSYYVHLVRHCQLDILASPAYLYAKGHYSKCQIIHKTRGVQSAAHPLFLLFTSLYIRPLCVDVGIGGIFLDELATWTYVLTHEHGEYVVSCSGVLNGHLLEQSSLGVHGSLPQLLGVHFTKTLIALDGDASLAAVTELGDEAILVGIVVAVALVLALATEVEGWGGDEEVSVFDELGHVAVEESHRRG